MPTVTVDADDLEALLFATGAIKNIESTLKARERDPLAHSAAPRLTAAHDRLAAQWRRAKREEPETPTAGDIAELRRIFIDNGEAWYGEAWSKEYPTRLAQTLQLVESGPLWVGNKIDWPAPSTPEFRPIRQSGYGVRLTARGEHLLADASMLPKPEDYAGGPLIIDVSSRIHEQDQPPVLTDLSGWR